MKTELPGIKRMVICVAMATLMQTSPGQMFGQQPTLRATLKGNRDDIHCLVFSPDGKTLASAGGCGYKSGEILLWDLATGNVTKRLGHHNQSVNVLACSPDAKSLASGSDTVKLWDVASGKEMATFRHGDHIVGVAFSPDGKRLATAGGDNTIRLWDLERRKFSATLNIPEWTNRHFAIYFPLVFSPDGRTLASWSRNNLKLWDVATAKEKALLQGHRTQVLAAAFNPGGTIIATGSLDGTLKLWATATAAEKDTLIGHTNPVICVSFSPDGKTLASGGADQAIRLWDVSSGKAKAAFKAHNENVVTVSFSPDGKLLASGSTDKTIKLWNISAPMRTEE